MTVYIVPIEPIDSRYTKQWFEEIPNIIKDYFDLNNINEEVKQIEVENVGDKTTPGAFLDFCSTNIYKANQVIEISKMFSNGTVKPNDKFLITDAWNFVITTIRYMSDLMNVPVEIHGIWHAGSYDPTDILGEKMNKNWSLPQERSWYYACDYNYYATEFHKNMFLKNLKIYDDSKAIVSGQPHNNIMNYCENFHKQRIGNLIKTKVKENIMVFTHRLNFDKQPDIFRDLVTYLPNDWKYILTQEHNLKKHEYYDLLSKSKIAFSCSLHENLGIGQMESVLCGNIPLVPNRASYTEIYKSEFIYPSEWTENWNSYQENRSKLLERIKYLMDNYKKYIPVIEEQKIIIKENYMTCSKMLDTMFRNSCGRS